MLATIVAAVVTAICNWLEKEIPIWIKERNEKKAVEANADALAKETKDAQTKEEREKASKDIIGSL